MPAARPSASPTAAYAQCYDGAAGDDAKLVMMAALTAGDLVLTASVDGALAATRVLVNEHAARDARLSLLEVTTAGGAVLSLTPDHPLYIDGRLRAARELTPARPSAARRARPSPSCASHRASAWS